MLYTSDYLILQQIKMSISTYVLSENPEEDEENLQNIPFSDLITTSFEDAESEFKYLYSFIEECAVNYYDKYVTIVNKMILETQFLDFIFNNEIEANQFMKLVSIWSLNFSYRNPNIVANFIKNNVDIFKPFKNITFTKHNLSLILSFFSKLLIACQSFNYQQMIDNKDYLNPLYEDAEFFISKKQEVGLE